MEELKKLYNAPEAQILCFKAMERLAVIWDGDGVVGDDQNNDYIYEGEGESGGDVDAD